MPGTRQLLGGRQASWSRTDDGDLLAGLRFRRLGHDPAFLPGAVGDCAFDRFDRDGHVVDVERAGGFARRGADAARDFGEVVRRVQVECRLLPIPAIDEIVPVGDLVVDRAAVVTVRDAAIHAARGLRFQLALGQRHDELMPMLHARFDRLVLPVGALELQKPCRLTHRLFVSLSRRADGCFRIVCVQA